MKKMKFKVSIINNHLESEDYHKISYFDNKEDALIFVFDYIKNFDTSTMRLVVDIMRSEVDIRSIYDTPDDLSYFKDGLYGIERKSDNC